MKNQIPTKLKRRNLNKNENFMEDEKVPISHLPKIKTFNGRGFHEFWMGEGRKGERGDFVLVLRIVLA